MSVAVLQSSPSVLDTYDVHWTRASARQFFVSQGPQDASKVAVLLHGYLESGEKILGRLGDLFPSDWLVIAPCGPFPVPKKNPERGPENPAPAGTSEWSVDFAWYFFDPSTSRYFVGPEEACGRLASLIQDLGLEKRELVIVGYSQGGYLAPFAGLSLPNTRRVVGINCIFRPHRLPPQMPFVLDSLHGDHDLVVSPQEAQEAHAQLMSQGNRGSFQLIEGEGHRTGETGREMLKKLIISNTYDVFGGENT